MVIRERKKVMSFKLTDSIRPLLLQLGAQLTMQRGRKHTMSDIIEEALRLLAMKYKVDLLGRSEKAPNAMGEEGSGRRPLRDDSERRGHRKVRG
jgi:hypothetical protein